MYRRFFGLLLLALTSFALAGGARAASESPTPAAQGAQLTVGPPVAQAPAPALRRTTTGIETRVTAALAAQGRANVVALAARLKDARDPVLVAELNRQIAQSKLDTDLQILRVNATYARARGDVPAAMQFEHLAVMMLHPTIVAPVSGSSKGGGR